MVPAAGPCRGRGVGLAPCDTCWGPDDWAVPGGSLWLWSWAAGAAVVWRVWTQSLTRPVSRTVRPSTRASAGALGQFCVDADTFPFGSEDANPGSRVCVCVCVLFFAESAGPASWARLGAPPLLRGPCVRLLCFLCPLQAGPALFLFVSFFRSFFCVSFFFGSPSPLSFALGSVCLPPTQAIFIFSLAAPSIFFPPLPGFWFLAPVSCSPPLLVPILLFFGFFAPFCCFRLLFVPFFWAGGLPRACFLRCLLTLQCSVPCCSSPWHGFPCCGAPWGGGGAGSPCPAVALSFCGVFCPGRPVFSPFFACSCFLLCPAPAFGVVRSVACVLPCCAMLAYLCHAVPCFGLLCGLVARRPALLLAALVLFWPCAFSLCCAVWCGSVVRCCPLCALPFVCPAVCCVAECVLLYCGCCLVLPRIVMRCAVPVCGWLGCVHVVVSHALLCLPVLGCVVCFVAVILLFAALSPVLARRPWVWRCCALWRCLRSVGLFLPALCLAARLVRCCGVLSWSTCAV